MLNLTRRDKSYFDQVILRKALKNKLKDLRDQNNIIDKKLDKISEKMSNSKNMAQITINKQNYEIKINNWLDLHR